MKDKSIKQPWPRSAKITVWVLGIVTALSLAWQLSFRIAVYEYIKPFEYDVARSELDTLCKKQDAEMGINREEGYMLGADGEKLDIPSPFMEVSPHAIQGIYIDGEQRAFQFCFPLFAPMFK